MDERPLACVVPKDGPTLDIAPLRAYLATRVAKWWIPERWAFIKEVPKTSVGKFDKKALRANTRVGQIEEFFVSGEGRPADSGTENLLP